MGNTPYAKIPVSNGIDITFWVNEVKTDDRSWKKLSPSITKGWKDKNDEWHNQSISLNMNDLYRLFAVITGVKNLEDKFKAEQKEKTSSGSSDSEEKVKAETVDLTK